MRVFAIRPQRGLCRIRCDRERKGDVVRASLGRRNARRGRTILAGRPVWRGRVIVSIGDVNDTDLEVYNEPPRGRVVHEEGTGVDR